MFKTEKVTKPLNPILETNFLGRIFFTWVIAIFRLGLKRAITEDDVYAPLNEHSSMTVTNHFHLLWQNELKSQKRPSLLRVLLKEFGCSIFSSNTLYSTAETVLRIVQLYSLGGLVSYFTLGQTVISRSDALVFALGISISTVVIAVIYHPFIFYNFQRSLKIRVGLCSLIYKKILKLTKSTTFDGMNGQAINLMSNDVSTFEMPLSMIYIVWKGPTDALIFGYILYLEIGISAIYGVVFLAVFIPIQVWISKKSAFYHENAATLTDRRVKFMNEILHGIQVIKMYAWEKSFSLIVNKIRKKELNAFRGLYNVRAGIATLYAISRISIFLCLISYVYLGDSLTARQVFMVSAFLMDLNLTMVYYWPMAIAEVAGTYVATKRIEKFLLHSEENEQIINNINHNDEPNESSKLITDNGKTVSGVYDGAKGVQFCNVSAVWSPNDSNFGLNAINLNATMKNLYAVVGQIGCGKTSLFSIIIGDLKPDVGKVIINGTVSYASQEPWLFDGSIRQNITFIEHYDEKRYKEVCRVCALDRDFDLLPYSDLTLVGERGVILSGGQKSRVSLARAIYRNADIYLLDDPLSAVDAKVGKHIFTECIQSYLREKCVFLVTHQIQYLHNVENVILMSNGCIKGQGTFQELSELNQDSLLSLSVKAEFIDSENDRSREMEIRKIASQVEAETEKQQDETLQEGSVSYRVYMDYIKSINSKPCFVLVSILLVLYQMALMGIDYFLALWVNWEESVAAKNLIGPSELLANNMTSVRNSTANDGNLDNILKTREHYILSFAILTMLVVYVMSHKNFAFFKMCLRASENLHNQLFEGICFGTMMFFNSNPSGRILNRFSKDIQVADIRIPGTLNDTVQCLLELITTGIVVSIINPWALLPTIFFGALILGLRSVYIKTSRCLNRIQALTGSPIYSHTNATIQGLSTIRAFNAQDVLIQEFGVHLNNQSGPMFLCNAITTAFALWLDTANGLYVAFIAMSCLLLSDATQAGQVGFIILKAIVLIAATQWGVRQSAELENSMVSVERIMEYSNLEPERDSFEKHPPDAWPEFGRIKFCCLSLKYGPDTPNVLTNLNFDVKSEEKIGIVGRTGAGKSSIIQALFRLALIEGRIEIDHVNIATLPLQYLRKNIGIIPQDPILFSGSIRNNLDTFRNKTDCELWNSLEHVQLKSLVSSLPGGLEFRLTEGGGNFSLGQRQLICLARAILRKNKILILDEATANVDPETDQLIQKSIRTKFANCTVLTIAHRLHTVLDSDRIMVIDAGQIVEFDAPGKLLKNADGHLRKLLDESAKRQI